MTDRHDADQNERADQLPGDLPLFDTGWDAVAWDFTPGEDFWQGIAGLDSGGVLGEGLDRAMAGKSVPRVWLILHEPDEPESASAVALAFARELGTRDQAVLVLDCDDRSQYLTRWAERLEAEGWIDLARYGTSVLTSGVPLPFAGRQGYLLGVGSFAPTDVTAAEVEQMVSRLRRQADDLILVAPADLAELWAPVAGIRLLCWDRGARSGEQIEKWVAGQQATAQPLTGLVGLGQPVAPAAEVVTEPEIPVAESESPTVAEDVDTGGVDVVAGVDADAPSSDFETPAAGPESGPDEEAVAAAEAPEVNDDFNADDTGWSDAPALAGDDAGGKGTSGVFWFLAIAAVVIVGILGTYWYQYVRVPAGGERPAVQDVAVQDPVTRIPADRVTGELANQDDPHPPTDEAAGTDGTLAPADTTTTDQSDRSTTSGDVAAGAADLGDAGPFAPRQAAPTTTESVAADEPVADEVPARPEFSMAPYRTKVGGSGWALHLYSFPDTTGARIELDELHRRGFETELRVVETLKKGRWWRIYVGDFASRTEARAAAPMLKEKLRTDWANPTRF